MYFYCRMRPDYPNKIFSDGRAVYCLLMATLAMDTACFA